MMTKDSSPKVQGIKIGEITSQLVSRVFETMLSKTPVPIFVQSPHNCQERISGSVGFAGESVTGAVYLHLSNAFANNAASIIFDLPPNQGLDNTEVNDVVGELTNMVAGGLKSVLCDMGVPCAVSTPTIIRGTSFAVEPMPDVERICVMFDCD